uniref:RING-type E3 ubiquitin transferase n=1 Tax=Quercus lobata TaxID=97700 RepID=A0A7N2LFS6_QUELO
MGGCCCSSRKAHLHGTPVYYYVSNTIYYADLLTALIIKMFFIACLCCNLYISSLLASSSLANDGLELKCPPILEEHESLRSHDGAASALTAEFLVDFGLDASTPDTYRAPPAPLPYDLVLGYPQSTESESARGTVSGDSFETLTTCEDLEESDCKAQANSLCVSPRKLDAPNFNERNVSVAKEDICPNVSVAEEGACPKVSVAEEEDVCPICLEEYDAENPNIITRCEHHFHLSCILEWMERSDACPICDQLSKSLVP